ncbi:GNAT family N-acetyltransferase [SAR202 cluster bacterium AC-647-N09_OGT_505m]|nr:GNAT family N-acetyltransferase [SAR202 cluster bacterium AC-647-N09_OGT_505m]
MVDIIEIRDPTNGSWIEMRKQLWPRRDFLEHQTEIKSLVAEPARFTAFLALSPEGKPIGFAETTLRRDYVNGCESSPAAFLEGIFVIPEFRRVGVAKRLLEAVERWGQSKGCIELASDAEIDNIVSHEMHYSLGFKETERVIYFKKTLGNLE